MDISEVFRILERNGTLNLFPTENRMSPRALRALATDAVHRYPGSEGPGFFYGDTMGLDRLYAGCEELARRFFGVLHASVGFLSGLHAMQSVLSALGRPGDRVWTMDPSCGGHYATSAVCERMGLVPSPLPFSRSECTVDVDALAARVAREGPPAIVYLDVSTLLRLPPVSEIRAALGPEPYLCVDVSQVLGLLAGAGERIGPAAGASSCSGSTHKSFPGPQKGIFLCDDPAVAERVRGWLPFAVSSAHANSVGALAITLAEMMEERVRYAADVPRNARALAGALAGHGFDVAGGAFGYGETHQVWVSPPECEEAVAWGKRLLHAGVRSTVVVLPATGRPGLRLGVQELTRVGMGPAEMERVAGVLARCLLEKADPETIRRETGVLGREFSGVRYVAEYAPVLS